MMWLRTELTFIMLAMCWCFIFAGISFYWAAGGLIGVKSLGGDIYEMSVNPDPSFLFIVFLTGLIKLFGIIPLLLLFKNWNQKIINQLLYYITKTIGILLFFYGMLNFIFITIGSLNMIEYNLDTYATFWRLIWWEPFWMVGGFFYFFSVQKI